MSFDVVVFLRVYLEKKNRVKNDRKDFEIPALFSFSENIHEVIYLPTRWEDKW